MTKRVSLFHTTSFISIITLATYFENKFINTHLNVPYFSDLSYNVAMALSIYYFTKLNFLAGLFLCFVNFNISRNFNPIAALAISSII